MSAEKLKELILSYDAVLLGDIPEAERSRLLKFCYANQVRTYLSPMISDVIEDGAEDINLFDTPLKLIKGLGISIGNRIVKRVLDIILSALALVILSPLFLVIAVCIKLEDHGPVFFRQKRVTIHGQVFEILKFRSMIPDAEAEGKAMPAVENDSRITKTGRIIRSARLDELPQFINILRGEMSLVGPRPERVEHVRKYTSEIPEWPLREAVRGGLTGYAQVYGKYNTSASDKLKLDLMYIENYSLLLDFKLILITVRTLFQKESTEGFSNKEISQIYQNCKNEQGRAANPNEKSKEITAVLEREIE
jgi:exopolysaccharide biosynthesis polyprenyl glycosylphosphotransferase